MQRRRRRRRSRRLKSENPNQRFERGDDTVGESRGVKQRGAVGGVEECNSGVKQRGVAEGCGGGAQAGRGEEEEELTDKILEP